MGGIARWFGRLTPLQVAILLAIVAEILFAAQLGQPNKLMFDETHYVRQMLRNGASGYVLKNADQATLSKAINTVLAGKEFIDDGIKHKLIQESITGQRRSMFEVPLTKREKEILKLIAEENSNQEIADKLFLSLRTVETHRFNLTQKLEAKNTVALVKEAIKRGLID